MSEPDPTPAPLPHVDAVARGLREAGASVDPCELHGSLCGFIAGGGRVDPGRWLERLEVDAERKPAPGGALDDLRAVTLGQFADRDFGFELLMPDEDAPLSERVDALLGWCRGFLGGFGLAAPPPGALSEEATEALGDLGRIAAADPGQDEAESDEEALAELVEFARVAALLMHGDCARGAERRRRAH